MSDASNTATGKTVDMLQYLKDKGLAVPVAIVRNNERPILGDFSDAETLALGALLDRLEGLERATRIRLNPAALETMREEAESWIAMADTRSDRVAAQGWTVLLEMYDAIQAVPK